MAKPALVTKTLSGAALSPWFEALAQLRQLQRTCEGALTACSLPRHCCVVERLHEGELHLIATSPAAAVRLRQALPSLVRQLCAAGVRVHTCRISGVRTLT